MKRAPVTENDVKDLVKAWYDKRGAWSYGAVQNGLGVHGIHDRIGCVPLTVTRAMVGKRLGFYISVEAKRPGRRNEKDRGMTPHQFNNLKDTIAAGGISICCDGAEDLAQLDGWIKELTGG